MGTLGAVAGTVPDFAAVAGGGRAATGRSRRLLSSSRYVRLHRVVRAPSPRCSPSRKHRQVGKFPAFLQVRSTSFSPMEDAERKSTRPRKWKISNLAPNRWRTVCTGSSSLASGHNEGIETEAQVKEEHSSATAEDVAEPSDRISKGKEIQANAGRFSLPIEVDVSLKRFVIGKGGSMRRTLEEEQGVKIIFPASREATNVVIEGNTIESVTKTSEQITRILDEAVKSRKVEYSHFISFPLAMHSDLVEKLHHFQSSILGELSSGLEDSEIGLGIDKSIFINPKTFHLTVLMLKLWNEERIRVASEVLEKISARVKDALENRPLYIQLKELHERLSK